MARPTPDCPSKVEILVIGNSHTTGIEAALTEKTRPLIDVVNLAVFFDPENRRNKVLRSEIADLFRPKRIFCTFGGSEHSVLGLLESPVKFDFMTPNNPSLDPSRKFVLEGLVRATLLRAMTNALDNARDLRHLYECPITIFARRLRFASWARSRCCPGCFKIGWPWASARQQFARNCTNCTATLLAPAKLPWALVFWVCPPLAWMPTATYCPSTGATIRHMATRNTVLW